MRTGTLLVARDEDEARELERQIAFRESLGLRAERLRPSEAREREPALAPDGASCDCEAPDDHSVDPRRAARGASPRLRVDGGAAARARARPCASSSRAPARRSRHGGDDRRRAGHREPGGRPGARRRRRTWVEQIEGLPAHARVPVRPVKGQIVRLRDPAGAGLLARVVRFAGGYLVPRADGRYVLGATMEERGFDTSPRRAASTSCCATHTSSCPACQSSRSRSSAWGFGRARRTTRRPSARGRSRA